MSDITTNTCYTNGITEAIFFDRLSRLSNFVFTGIFVLEAIVKIITLKMHYFKKAWNVFDFIIVISSLVGM